MFKYELGVTAKDVITGFYGVVTGRVDYITGCRQYLLVPHAKKVDTRPQSEWLDEDRLEQMKTKKFVLGAAKSGPDRTAPTK